MSDWKVELVDDNISEFHVQFRGPADSEQPCWVVFFLVAGGERLGVRCVQVQESAGR
mgnify:CR=1 FL=1